MIVIIAVIVINVVIVIIIAIIVIIPQTVLALWGSHFSLRASGGCAADFRDHWDPNLGPQWWVCRRFLGSLGPQSGTPIKN